MHLHVIGLPHWPYLWSQGHDHLKKLFDQCVNLKHIYTAAAHIDANDTSMAYRVISLLDMAHDYNVTIHLNFMESRHKHLVPDQLRQLAGWWDTSEQMFTRAAYYVVQKRLLKLTDAIRGHPALGSIGIDSFNILLSAYNNDLLGFAPYHQLIHKVAQELGVDARTTPSPALSTANVLDVTMTGHDGYRIQSDEYPVLQRLRYLNGLHRWSRINLIFGAATQNNRWDIEQHLINKVQDLPWNNVTLIRYGFSNNATDSNYSDAYTGLIPTHVDFLPWYNKLRGTQ